MARYTQRKMSPTITRRGFGSLLAGGLASGVAARAQSRPPNVLFLIADELRGDSLGFMGHPVVKTPNLDALARGGVALRHCFSAAPASLPARVSALTGAYPSVHGAGSPDSQLRAGQFLLPRAFAKKGYRTGAIGDLTIPGHGLEHLFDFQATFSGDYQALLAERYPALEGDAHSVADKMESHGSGAHWLAGANRLPAQDCPEAWALARAMEFAEGAESAEPWFLFVGLHKPVDSFVAPFPWPRRYPAEQIGLPKLPAERPAPPTSEDRDADYITAGLEAMLTSLRQVYYGGISFLDEQVGALVRKLHSLGQLENTLIVVTSDHGNMLGELGRMGAGVPYDGATHVPAVFHYQAGFEITGGVDRVVDTTCLAPTILELAGLEAPDGLGSSSAKEILTVVGADWDEVAFQELGLRAVRTPQWKLVEPGDHPSWEPQLFNLEDDPRESTNLYDDPASARAQAELAARLQELEAAA